MPQNLDSVDSSFLHHFLPYFLQSVKLLSSVLIGWGPERWRNEVSAERGGHVTDSIKTPHHLKLSVKSIIQTNVLHAWSFQGAKAVMSHSLGNMMWAHYIWNRKMQPEVMRETVSIILTMPLLPFVPSSNSSFGTIERDWRLSLLID